MSSELFAAFLLGLVSAGHCLGMCGGLIMAAGIHSKNFSIGLFYNLGRISSYMSLGLVFGLISSTLPSTFFPSLKIISALLLIFTALYLLNWNRWITIIEKAGLPFWTIMKPIAKQLLPVNSIPTATALGFIWGFIPCGLVYTALAYSASFESPIASASAMGAFGLGTFPAMLGTSLAANKIKHFLSLTWLKYSLAVLMTSMAILILVDAVKHT